MKRAMSFFLAGILFLMSVPWLNEVMIEKENNRYYMLQKELRRLDETYELQIYGSCHAYTSYNPEFIRQEHGISAYVLANPSEIIPVTYLQMLERFQYDVPRVALVDIWGTNPYDTYIPADEIFRSYMPASIEGLPLSSEKNEVIRSFDTLDIWNENIPLVKYKSRILGMKISAVDFSYSFEAADARFNPEGNADFYAEMNNRFANYGYKKLPSVPLEDYGKRQASVSEDALYEPEPVILKYIDKIIELCDSHGVKLIFYRAPYVVSENEWKKANFLRNYLNSKGIAFYDLEKELQFDSSCDFYDYEHLSERGAEKATVFLNEIVLPYMQ